MQARACGAFTNAHEAFWAAARKAHGDTAGTRELIDVLLLHRHMAAADVVAGLTAALGIGAIRADVVAVEARKHQTLPGVTDPSSRYSRRRGAPTGGPSDRAATGRPDRCDRRAATGRPAVAVGGPLRRAAHPQTPTCPGHLEGKRVMTLPIRRRRGLTEQAAVAAVDQACRRLRLPTIRDLVPAWHRRGEGTALLPGVPGGAAAGRV